MLESEGGEDLERNGVREELAAKLLGTLGKCAGGPDALFDALPDALPLALMLEEQDVLTLDLSTAGSDALCGRAMDLVAIADGVAIELRVVDALAAQDTFNAPSRALGKPETAFAASSPDTASVHCTVLNPTP